MSGPQEKYLAFWEWWAQAAPRVADAIGDRSPLSPQLTLEINAGVRLVHPEMAWEVGPGVYARNALTLTGRGNMRLRRVTAQWLASAPARNDFWEYLPARRSHRELGLDIGGQIFRPADFRIAFDHDRARERFDVILWHPAFPSLPQAIRQQTTFLMLDQFLGEDEVQRWLGHIASATAPPHHAHLLEDLLDEVDRFRLMSTGSRYTVAEAKTKGGLPLIISFNSALKEIDYLKQQYHVRVHLSLESPTGGGLPSEIEVGQLNRIEDGIASRLGEDAVFTARVTRPGGREIHYYVSDPRSAAQALGGLPPQRGLGLQQEVTNDPEWKFYNEGLRLVHRDA